ncbi:MAG: DNA polymerase III subunit gamma/tau [Gammaproteobacteria bacterium]|nr:DNA polymerase III subunit gamma/tau [Gammaproteobacteria bacterium]
MSHQVLARKYRPKTFANLMGQTHVSQAIGNALKSGRLHHAYLFTGTRGVGKTTIARLLAKALNCETGVVEEPCGTCDTCIEIDEGRYIDLIEVDAASKTKVEDTRELLENLHYASTRGRYKIYIIDEVHMLSGHSFNALLKTLEEPPEHVKFLLATTDPQKLPITILSRCLKFNLKRLSLKQINDQLSYVLTEEKIPFEAEALMPLAVAADGSMRDALSLVDQAISFGDNQISLKLIEEMLGNLSSVQLDKLIHCLLVQDANGLINNLHALVDHGAEPASILMEVINQLQQLAMYKAVPDVVNEQSTISKSIKDMANEFNSEEVQLYYQIALHGYKDIQISPLPIGALEMTFLRMLTFTPVTKINVHTPQSDSSRDSKNTAIQIAPEISQSQTKEKESQSSAQETQIDEVAVTAQDHPAFAPPIDDYPSYQTPVKEDIQDLAQEPIQKPTQEPIEQNEGQQNTSQETAKQGKDESDLEKKNDEIESFDNNLESYLQNAEQNLTETWFAIVEQIECSGFEKEMFKHCFLNQLKLHDGALSMQLGVDSKHDLLVDHKQQQRLLSLVKDYFVKHYNLDKINIIYQENIAEQLSHTPRQVEHINEENLKQFLLDSINNDPELAKFRDKFSATIIETSIKSVNTN